MSELDLTVIVLQFFSNIGKWLGKDGKAMGQRQTDQDQWLAEAANALAEAERLAGLLALARPRQDLVLAALQAEIMGLRGEVERLRREHAGEKRRNFHPEWLEYSAWHSPTP